MGLKAEDALNFDTRPALDYLDISLSGPCLNSVNALGFKNEPISSAGVEKWKTHCKEALQKFRGLFVTPFESSAKTSPSCLLAQIQELISTEYPWVDIAPDLFIFV